MFKMKNRDSGQEDMSTTNYYISMEENPDVDSKEEAPLGMHIRRFTPLRTVPQTKQTQS